MAAGSAYEASNVRCPFWKPLTDVRSFKADCVMSKAPYSAPTQVHISSHLISRKQARNYLARKALCQNGICSRLFWSLLKAVVLVACPSSFPTFKFGVRGSWVCGPILQTNTNSIFLLAVQSIACPLRREHYSGPTFHVMNAVLTPGRATTMLGSSHVFWARPRMSLGLGSGLRIRDTPL